MWRLAALPFLLQGGLMLADEAFHLRRGLPAWERWGHPLDTLSVVACYAWALLAPATPAGLAVYAGAAAFSCLCVTKDEWVHARHCSGAEGWLHAALFLLHPVLLAIVGLWGFGEAVPRLGPALRNAPGHGGFGAFLAVQAALTASFGAWQAAYWNGPWGRARRPARRVGEPAQASGGRVVSPAIPVPVEHAAARIAAFPEDRVFSRAPGSAAERP